MIEAERAAIIRRWREKQAPGPYMVQLNPTMACNLNCLFCRRQDGLKEYYKANKDIPDSRYLEIIADAVSLGTRAINVKGGGEPMLRRGLLRRIVSQVKEAGLYGSLITNGTLIDDAMADVFVRSAWDEISISVDGPDSRTHDYLRDKNGTLERIKDGVRRIAGLKASLGARLPHIKFHLVLTNRNHLGVEPMLRLAHELGVRELEIDSLNVSMESARPLALDPHDAARFQESLDMCIALAARLGIGNNLENFRKKEYVQRSELPPSAVNLPMAESEPAQEDSFLTLPCYFPWFQATITANGRMSPCCYGEIHLPKFNLHEISFREAWLGPVMQEYRDAMASKTMMPFCRNCTPSYREQSERVRGLLGAPQRTDRS
ncbi:MAG: radical SAM protein [Elusimicrobiota bacterium]